MAAAAQCTALRRALPPPAAPGTYIANGAPSTGWSAARLASDPQGTVCAAWTGTYAGGAAVFAVTGVSWAAFAAWRYSIAPAGTTRVAFPTLRPDLYIMPEDVAGAAHSVALDPCRLPSATVHILREPGAARVPAAASCAARSQHYHNSCFPLPTPNPDASGKDPYRANVCSHAETATCGGDQDDPTSMAVRTCGNLPTMGGAELFEKGGAMEGYGSSSFIYPIQASAVIGVHATNLSSGIAGCQKQPGAIQCSNLLPAQVAVGPGTVCGQTGWPSAQDDAMRAACQAGAVDGAGTYACAGVRCAPNECWDFDDTLAKAAFDGTCLAPFKARDPASDAGMQLACLGVDGSDAALRAPTRGTAQLQAYPLSASASAATGSGGASASGAVTPFQSVPMAGTVTGTESGAACPCAGASDAAACRGGLGAGGGATEGAVCRQWCGKHLPTCVTASARMCSSKGRPNDPLCACTNRFTTPFPGAGGLTYAQMADSVYRASGSAAPAALPADHCWWMPCVDAVDEAGGGRYLPTSATAGSGGGSTCPASFKQCAVNITKWSIAQAAYNDAPDAPGAVTAVRQAAAALSQDCSICPPPPDAPRGATGTSTKCSSDHTTGWALTVYNETQGAVTVAAPTLAPATVQAGGFERLPPAGGAAFLPPPGATLTVQLTVLPTKTPPTFTLQQTATPTVALDASGTVCLAVLHQEAVLVAGAAAAAAYAARVTTCVAQGTCGGQLPVPAGEGGATVPAQLQLFNFSSSPAMVVVPGVSGRTQVPPTGASVPLQGAVQVNGTLLVNGGDAAGGASFSPLAFPPAPAAAASVLQKGPTVWAAAAGRGGSGAQGVLVVFDSVAAATSYTQTVLATAAAGNTQPLPAPSGGGGPPAPPSGTWSIVAENFTTALVGAVFGTGASVGLLTNQAVARTVPALASISVDGTAFGVPQDPSTAQATARALPTGVSVAIVTLGRQVRVGVYATLATAQAYAAQMQGLTGTLPPPTPPADIPTGGGGGGSSGGGSGGGGGATTTPAWVWYAAGGGAALLLGILVWILLARRKKTLSAPRTPRRLK